ncbi:MAG: cobyrinate a,c-diamide synthase [Mangrovibacterium sp.]
MKTSSFLIAAPNSNSGKTLLSLALMRALVKRGINVQAFKCGPDYIDPMHHKAISGKASYNLDLWMSSEQHVKNTFNKQAAQANVSIVEGVMGLFDGANKAEGSSAEIAKSLDISVIIVLDAKAMAYSSAALLYGLKNFDSKLKIGGVIFNRVSGEPHYQFLREAAKDAGIESLGYMPHHADLNIESRHLGLHLPHENQLQHIEFAAELAEKHININRLLKLTEQTHAKFRKEQVLPTRKLRIAIAHDEAFNFTYQANINALNNLGTMELFSPLHDAQMPEADLLYLPGGYPELYATKLAQNIGMKQSIRAFIESEKITIAECGGMMYLGRKLTDANGKTEDMCGVFNFSSSFEDAKLHLGYRKIMSTDLEIRGHEFHYSKLIQCHEESQKIGVENARGAKVESSIFKYKKCWASYLHLYLGEEEMMQKFIAQI